MRECIEALIAARNHQWNFRGYAAGLYWFDDLITKSTCAVETLTFGSVMSSIYIIRQRWGF